MLDDAVATIGTAAANLTTVLDPERVVVGGGMAPAFLPALRDAIAGTVPFPPPVEAARFGDDAPWSVRSPSPYGPPRQRDHA